jgi:thiamine-phosphate pyrophosphorylase
MGSVFPGPNRDVYCFADDLDSGALLLDAGARIIQFRNKKMSDSVFREVAIGLLVLVRSHPGAVLIVNDRVDIAVDIGAHGVHVGQKDRDIEEVTRLVPDRMIVGVSCRTPQSAIRAEEAGASCIGAGAVYPSSTKPDSEVIGPEGLARICASVRIPVVAVGGITLDNIARIIDSGAMYFGMISAIRSYANPTGVIGTVRSMLGNPMQLDNGRLME